MIKYTRKLHSHKNFSCNISRNSCVGIFEQLRHEYNVHHNINYNCKGIISDNISVDMAQEFLIVILCVHDIDYLYLFVWSS